MESTVIDVCCAAEGNYVAHSAAMLHSVLAQHGRGEVRITYLHPPEYPRAVHSPLTAMVERGGGSISFVEVPDERCEGLPVIGFTGKATWYRALAPELLPGMDRVLFLDCDLLALDSLQSLWETDVSNHFVAAVTNVFQLDHLHRPAELGLDMPQRYFNAGVLLMNLDLMRREQCANAVLEYGRVNRQDLMFRDQDALNVVLAERWRALHPRWNCMNSVMGFPWSVYVFGREATDEARRNPAIRHFEGPGLNKPWHVQCDQPLREVYFEHRSQTPWPTVQLDGKRRQSVRQRGTHTVSRLRNRARRLGARAHPRLQRIQQSLVNASARTRAKLRNRRVITRVAKNEDMLTGGVTLRHYFEVGESALECIQDGLRAAGAALPRKILDLPSGYGRVLRYLRATWPDAEITAMELAPDAAQFCADAFGAKPVVSRQPFWLVTDAGDGYDLLWCGSLLTHFNQDDWPPALKYFRDRLALGGVLVFTTHGNLSIGLLARDAAAVTTIGDWVGDYGMGSKAKEMSRVARESGFAFGHYGDDEGPFGLSVSSPEWVRETVDRVHGLEFVLHQPRGWFQHQDVWTFVRTE